MVATPTKRANVSAKHCFVCGGGVFVAVDGKIVPCYTLLVNQPYFLNILQKITVLSQKIQHDDQSKICKRCMNTFDSIRKHEDTLIQRKSELRNCFEKHWFGQENVTSLYNSPIRLKRVSTNEFSEGKKTRFIVNTQTPTSASAKTTPVPSIQCVTSPRIQTQALKILVPSVTRIASTQVQTPALKTTLVSSSQHHVALAQVQTPPLKTTPLIPTVQHSIPQQVISHKLVQPEVNRPANPVTATTSSLPVPVANVTVEDAGAHGPSDKFTKISIQFPHSSKVYKMDSTDTLGIAVKCFAMNCIQKGLKTLVNDDIFRNVILSQILKLLTGEMAKYRSQRSVSLCSRTPYAIMNVTLAKLRDETTNTCPTLSTLVKGCHRQGELQSSLSIAMMLHSQSRKLTSFAYKIGYFLRWSGLRSSAMSVLAKMGLTVDGRSLTREIEKMGLDHDKEVIQWKIARDRYNYEKKTLQFLNRFFHKTSAKTETVLVLMNLLCSELPIATIYEEDPEAYVPIFDDDLLAVSHSFVQQMKNSKISVSNLANFCKTYLSNAEPDLTFDVYLDRIKLNPCPKFTFTGDNCDMHIQTRQKSNNNPNKSFHWFHYFAIRDPVSGDHLSDFHTVRLKDIPIRDFLPTNDDLSMLKRDFILLCTRIVVLKVKSLHDFKDCVFWHITHQYSKEAAEKTVEVPLGIIPRNENSTEGMMEIIEEISDKYGLEDPDEFLFMGGDQVTEDRARGCQGARCEEENRKDRLEQLWFKNEDWHFERIAYKCVLDKLSNSQCITDSGTYYSNAISLGNSHAVNDVMGSHCNKIKEFFQVHTSAMFVSAFLQHLGKNSVEDPIDIPESLGTVAERRRWLFSIIEKVLEKFVLPDIAALSNVKERLFQKVKCRVPDCNAQFLTIPGLRQHEKNAHDKKEIPKEKKVDDPVFNYGCVSLAYGLLLKNLDDAIKEGDGERVIRCWKYFTFIFKSTGITHKNYALAGLRLLASIKGLLTPALAHELIWNRFVNKHGGAGRCIPRDLRNEHLNKIAKEHIRSMGHSNITDANVIKLSRSMKFMEDIVRSFMESDETKHHKRNPHEKEQFTHCIERISKACMFQRSSGRKLEGFPNFKRNIYDGLEPITLKNWLTKYRNLWDMENKHNYRFS